MNPTFIAITGPIGSGKTTVARAIADRCDIPVVSFGEHVRKVALCAGLDANDRTVLQDLGLHLLRYPEPMCKAVLAQAPSPLPSCLIIDGVRHEKVFDTIRRLSFPRRVVLVYIDADETARRERYKTRSDDSLDAYEAHPVESEVNDALMSLADVVIKNEEGTALGLIVEKIVSLAFSRE